MRKVAVAMSCVLLSACGADADDGGGDESPSITVVASVLGLQDATGDIVQARMAIVEEGAFAEEALDPTLTLGTVEIALTAQRVRLLDGTQTTWYEADSRAHPELAYAVGTQARFDFALPTTRARYSSTVTLPAQASQLDAASEPGIGKDVDLVASGQFDGALLLVERLDTGEQTYASYPFRAELVPGPSGLEPASTLRGVDAGVVTIPAAAFSRRGTHEVVFVGLNVSEGGDAVSDGSVTFAGTAKATTLDIN